MVAAPAKVCLYARWDDGHDDDPLLVSEYAEEIFEYMREMEQKHLPQPNYLKIQHEVDGAARNILVNWLIVVHARFSLRCETLYLAVNVMDRFLSLKTVSLPKFQLVGIASLLIACKYEEIEVPGVAALEYMADYGYSRGEIVRAERYVLGTLRHELGCPSPLSFVRRLARIDGFLPAPRTLCAFVMEAALTDEIMIGAPPSMLAAGAMYLARCMLRIGAWTPQHAMVSGYSEQVVTECAKGLYNTISRLDSRSSVYQKYSEERFSGVAKFVEAFLRNGA
ncbi:cyclin-like protein [Zopfochytrium polystomum]|nr:cyclin-like protein [Zopfochytrium polystomum]